MSFSEYPKFSVLDDSPIHNSAPSPEDRSEDNTEQARAMHARSAEDHTRESTVGAFWATYIESYERVSKRDMATIVRHLKSDGHITRNGQWRDLILDEAHKTENAHFGRLVHVVEAIVNTAAAHIHRFARENRTCLFECRPDNETLSEVPGSSFHVDALHHLAKSTYAPQTRAGSARCRTMLSAADQRKINTADVVASWEVKLVRNPVTIRDDEKKTLGAAGHYLFADIRRKFHFSITVEATTARLWCHSRSHSGVTKAFDIHKNKAEFIQWILFASYGTEHQLGFDPTVTRVLDKHGCWQYQFDILDKDKRVCTYQTLKILHENCAARLYTRAMRVLKVRRVVQRGDSDSFSEEDPQTRALRDYWLNDDKQTKLEKEVQSALLEALRACTESEEELREVWRHFLEIVSDGVVEWEDVRDRVPGPPKNATPYTYADEKNPKGTKAASSKVEGNRLRETAEYIGPGKTPKTVASLLQLLGRKHCRTLYAHVCIDLYKIDEPAIFFFALDQTVFVLSWFRRIGWMHRDISPGNVMLFCLSTDTRKPLRERYLMKLADLEYCKEYTRISRHDPITGTADYMAVEAQDRSHIFANNGDEVMLVDGYFSHNFFHDLESTVWMALEFVMRRVPRQEILSRDWLELGPAVHKMKSLANLVFPNLTAASVQRRNLLKMRKSRDDLKELLTKVYGKDSPIANLTDLLRMLFHAYTTIENKLKDSDVPHEPASARRMPASLFEEQATIYDDIRAAFQQVSQYHANVEGQDAFIPFSRIDFATGEIREASETTQGDESPSGAMDFDEQNAADTTTTKRKAVNDAVVVQHRSKRSRTIAPPVAGTMSPRRTRSRTRIDAGRSLRRSSRLRHRTSGGPQ
ncbi:hypothetical protein HDZ31DRAFT_28594 [Schizophyllum fasciatum]